MGRRVVGLCVGGRRDDLSFGPPRPRARHGGASGGIGPVGARVLAAQITTNIILSNGGPDLDLHVITESHVVTGDICEASNPSGLCPYPFPRFPFDTTGDGKGKPR